MPLVVVVRTCIRAFLLAPREIGEIFQESGSLSLQIKGCIGELPYD